MIAGNGVISLLVYVIVIGLVFWLIWWLVDYIGLPEPFNKVVKVIIAVVAVVFLANILLGFVGHPVFALR